MTARARTLVRLGHGREPILRLATQCLGLLVNFKVELTRRRFKTFTGWLGTNEVSPQGVTVAKQLCPFAYFAPLREKIAGAVTPLDYDPST